MSPPQQPALIPIRSAPARLPDVGVEATNTIQNSVTPRGEIEPAAGENTGPGPIVNIRTPTLDTAAENLRPPLMLDTSTHLRPISPGGVISPSPRSPAPEVMMEDLTDDILPHEIPVEVTITWQGQEDWNHKYDVSSFPWIQKDRYKDLLPTRIIRKHIQAYHELEDRHVYHRHGICGISASPELIVETPFCFLGDYEVSTLIDNAISLICGFIHDHPRRKFSLNIYWACGYAQLSPQPNAHFAGSQNFKEMIRAELLRKRQTNFRDQDFISRRDETPFRTYEVVRDLVFLDDSLRMDGTEKKTFVDQIVERPAFKLMLICVYQGFGLVFLHHLLDYHDCSDDTPPRHNMVCFYQLECQDRVHEILRFKAMFDVRNVDLDFKHHNLESGEVMPLLRGPSSTLESRGPDSTPLETFGSGASGTVYKVWIDSAHHYLTGDPSCCFALKRFPPERGAEFAREIQMLRVLADHPKPDIVLHITSWTQSEYHYILYPAARSNLADYMQSVKRVGFAKHETLWFLRQLRGLAHAIDHVHHLKHPTNTEPNPAKDAHWGSHFDIKPQNILVFEKVPGYHPRFKIADFGSGVFKPAGGQEGHSELTSEARGTLTYFAPDFDRNGKVSRPFDMWALGCVYLELMLWVFGFFESSDGSFSTARFNCTGAAPHNRTDRFWEKVSTSQGVDYKLKSIVTDVMAELRERWCVNMPAFQGILTAVDKLLEIDTDGRWDSETLKTHMNHIYREAEADLQYTNITKSSFYSAQYKANCRNEFLRQTGQALASLQAEGS